jgi:hypothetical protein
VEVDACLSVGSGVTDASTRTNGTKTRTVEGIREDEGALGCEASTGKEGDARAS